MPNEYNSADDPLEEDLLTSDDIAQKIRELSQKREPRPLVTEDVETITVRQVVGRFAQYLSAECAT